VWTGDWLACEALRGHLLDDDLWMLEEQA